MQQKIGAVIESMIAYNYGCPELINHALKVFTFAKAIGEQENLSLETQQILETAAVLHDIGIRVSEEKYHAFGGKYQQIEGPAIAKELLEKLGAEDKLISRVCFLIGHHHEYDGIDGMDYQILVEADFLVNLFEENTSPEGISQAKKNIFKTKTGICFLENLFEKKYPRPSLFAADLERIVLERAKTESEENGMG